MKRHARNAFRTLTAAGFKCYDPVKDRPSWANAHFDISGEEGDPRIDYWERPWCDELQEMLDNYNLYAEWINPGLLGVYDK